MNVIKSSPLFDIGRMDEPTSPLFLDNTYHEVEKFCTPDSLEASSNYLNILLTTFGYPVPLVFDSTQVEEKCKIVNCVYALLQDRKSDAKERQELIEIINHMKRTQIELENQVINLKQENSLKEKHYIEIRTRSEANENIFKRQSTQNARLKEEISKLKNNISYIKTQYAHESNRHAQDLAKVEERMVKCMNLQYKTKMTSLEMNTQYPSVADNITDQDQVIQIRKKYTELLLKSNNNESNIKLENEELRKCLGLFYSNCRELLQDQMNRFNNNNKNIRNDHMTELPTEIARFNLPIENYGGKEAIDLIQQLLNKIKKEWNQQLDKQEPDLLIKKELSEKDEIINQLHTTIQELVDTQDQMIKDFEQHNKIYTKIGQGGFFDTLYPTPNDAYRSIQNNDDEEEDDDLILDLESGGKQNHKYKVLKRGIMRDQVKITDSAIQLGRERSQLEAERWAFEQMKMELQKQAILQESPSPSTNTTTTTTTTTTTDNNNNNNNNNTTNQLPNVSRDLTSHASSLENNDNNRARKRFKSWLGFAPSNN